MCVLTRVVVKQCTFTSAEFLDIAEAEHLDSTEEEMLMVPLERLTVYITLCVQEPERSAEVAERRSRASEPLRPCICTELRRCP